MNKVTFTIEGHPIGKQRARVAKGHAYTPQKTRDYEALVSQCAALAMGALETFSGDVALSLRAFVSGRSPDLDNIMKSVADGMNGIVYEDDRQIASAFLSRAKVPKAQERVEVVVQEMKGAID